MELKTPLYDCHLASKGKMVPFAGYSLPVQYEAGVIAEHMAVRERAGLFDVSHMAELVLKGRRDAVQAVPLDPPAFRELGIVTRDRRELRPAARRFITEARDIIRQIK